eukprot:4656125-Amphidinium_carterae.1
MAAMTTMAAATTPSTPWTSSHWTVLLVAVIPTSLSTTDSLPTAEEETINKADVAHDLPHLPEPHDRLQTMVPVWTITLNETVSASHVRSMRDHYATRTSLPPQCITVNDTWQAIPTCHTTRTSHNTTATFTTTCQGDGNVPLECVALSLYYATTQRPMPPDDDHDTSLDTTSRFEAYSEYMYKHAGAIGLLHCLQTWLLIYITFKYLTYKPPPQPRQRGPLEPFGAPRIRQAATATRARAAPASSLQHLLPRSAQLLLLTGGGPPQHVNAAMLESTIYSAPPSLAPHCLFAAILFIMHMETTMPRIQDLRDSLAQVLKLAKSQKLLIAGETVQYWARLAGMSEREYITSTNTPPYRRGNSADAGLMARLMGTSVWLFDQQLEPNMLSHATKPALAIQHTQDHFIVISCPTLHTDAIEYNIEKLSTLPLQLLSSPRTNAMTLFWAHNNSTLKHDNLLDVQFYHSHMAAPQAHLRLRLATPIFNYNGLLQHIERPDMTLALAGMMIKRQLPSWTAMTYVLAELETENTNVDDVMEIYYRMDQIIFNRVEAIITELLNNTTLEAQQARLAAAHVIETTMMEHPRIYRRFAIQLPLPVRHATTTTKMTIGEYQRLCYQQSPQTQLTYTAVPDVDNVKFTAAKPTILTKEEH